MRRIVMWTNHIHTIKCVVRHRDQSRILCSGTSESFFLSLVMLVPFHVVVHYQFSFCFINTSAGMQFCAREGDGLKNARKTRMNTDLLSCIDETCLTPCYVFQSLFNRTWLLWSIRSYTCKVNMLFPRERLPSRSLDCLDIIMNPLLVAV